jgi:hypothetical protein
MVRIIVVVASSALALIATASPVAAADLGSKKTFPNLAPNWIRPGNAGFKNGATAAIGFGAGALLFSDLISGKLGAAAFGQGHSFTIGLHGGVGRARHDARDVASNFARYWPPLGGILTGIGPGDGPLVAFGEGGSQSTTSGIGLHLTYLYIVGSWALGSTFEATYIDQASRKRLPVASLVVPASPATPFAYSASLKSAGSSNIRLGYAIAPSLIAFLEAGPAMGRVQTRIGLDFPFADRVWRGNKTGLVRSSRA